MISQLLSKAKLPSIFDLGAAVPAEGGDGGKTGGFSSLLNALGGPSSEAATAAMASLEGETPAAAAAVTLASPGEGGLSAAAVAATGKTLPLALPVLAVPATGEGDPADPTLSLAATSEIPNPASPETAGEGEAQDSEKAVVAVVEATAVAAILSNQLPSQATAITADKAASTAATAQSATRAFVTPLPLGPVNDRASASVIAAPARSEPAPAPSVALQVAPLPANGDQQATPRDALAAARGADASAVERGAANAGDRSAQRDPSGEQRAAPELAARPAAKATAETAPIQFSAAQSATTAPVVAQASAEPATDGVRPFAAERPGLETQVARELSRIVDSLSAAREALAAKTATLAFDHADFGELSLRFDQRRDGQLAVQLSAADPDAHRAVAAAVAERPAFAQTDTGANSQQQGQTTANGSARGAAGEREGNAAGNNAARQDRNEQQRGQQARADDTNRGGAGRSGIFA